MKAKTSIEDGTYTITLYGAEGAEDAVLKALQGMEVTPAKYSEGEIRLEFRQRTVTSPMPPGSARGQLRGLEANKS